MSRVIVPFAQFSDGTGAPLVNGWLSFLAAGTNNSPLDTYADEELQIPNANPLQLDGEGRCPDTFGQGRYRVILYSNNTVTQQPGQQIASFDPINTDDTPNGVNPEGDFAAWLVTTTYEVGDIVKYDQDYYRSWKATNLGNSPPTNPDWWEQIDFIRIWSEYLTYAIDVVIQYGDSLYVSLQAANFNNVPNASPAWWNRLGAGTTLNEWEENGTTFRPSASGYDLGDTTHLLGDVYQGDGAKLYLGADQDAYLSHTGTYLELINTTGYFAVNANQIYLSAAGLVGIGTATPGHLVDIDGGAVETRLQISTTGTDAGEAGILLKNSDKTAFNSGIEMSHGGGYTRFVDLADNEIMRLMPVNGDVGNTRFSGNVGVGSSTFVGYDRELLIDAGTTGTVNSALVLQGHSDANGTISTIEFRNGTDDIASITSNRDDAADAGSLRFLTQPTTGSLTFRGMIDSTGRFFINDTANSFMGLGLTINQAGFDNEILSLKSSDVNHGITSLADTDTFASFYKSGAGSGGLRLLALTAAADAIQLRAVATATDTTTSTSAVATIEMDSRVKSGTSSTALGATDNIFAVKNSGSTKFIIKGNGDYAYDGADVGPYDGEDDLALIASARFMGRSVSKRLRELGIINENGFISNSKITALTLGGITQLVERLESLETEVGQLRSLLAI